ncbi:MAG TPA: alpha/beta hydrolase [Acidimicrobiia bacterium]|nr:alpha/beta hydrolase [Acidimicrobiia bacterium]
MAESKFANTDRLRMHYLESGPEDGIPVLMIHGNLATGRFFEHIMDAAPDRYRFIAPDMRGFGDTERVDIDGTRGLRDWSDDAHALVQTLGISGPIHLVGWSTGGGAVANYTIDRPGDVASLTLIDPVSPYGFGATKDLDGTPCYDDFAGSGGGGVVPEFVERLSNKDRSEESPLSPRNVMNSSYWSTEHREPKEREDVLLEEVFKTVIGDGGYPGDMTTSENWPGIAPGTKGILNALSGKYCNWADIVSVDPKPPVLWTHGTADIVISDTSAWDMGNLGQLGMVPGWPGPDVYPPQPMVGQIRAVLEEYRDNGGSVQFEMIEGAGHGPHFDHAQDWNRFFFGFLEQSS